MNLNLTGHHVEITPAMRDYVAAKMVKIKRHFDNVIDVNVTLSVEKLKQNAEANVLSESGTWTPPAAMMHDIPLWASRCILCCNDMGSSWLR